ncbi:MAG TPA: hypothetical protein VK721_06660 [Solirubrobacteraceae bacterium]|nr:hypothetical protein [Solirubrobacteraceae bacterium]
MTSLRSRARAGRAHRWSSLRCALVAGAAVSLVGAAVVLAGVGSRAAAQTSPGEPTAQTDDSVPASRVTLIGASPQEGPDETWGIGSSEEGAAQLVRYLAGSGWSLGPALLDHAGDQLSGFKLDQPGADAPSPLAGQMTPSGAGVLVGTVPAAEGPRELVLVRDPGGSFQETLPVPTEGPAALAPGALAFAKANRAPLIAPLDESGGRAGALLVPTSTKGEPENVVLHWDGAEWTGEPIEVPASSSGEFHVVGIGASSPANAWLLGELSSGGYALFRRHLGAGGGTTWKPVASAPGGAAGEPLAVPLAGGTSASFTVPDAPTVLTQVLTVTGEGVWIDGERTDAHESTTMFLRPAGETGVTSLTSWCQPPSSVPACDDELPEGLPLNTLRSIAWADPSSPFGQRVMTGFSNGVSLRLDGTEFTRVLALGASVTPNDVGGTYGSAFSNPREGWLGQAELPVHLTLSPEPTRLAPWPVSFRHALLSIAPEPGVAVGALSSEALAVGDQGEIARYEPGKGWMPENLLSASGRPIQPAPVLRSVAWPMPSTAFAVGNEGQMWLWRGETGLWEPDPAAPVDFQGNLLGVAFDPNNPERGYAVGQGGVLLGYGKEWTQEAVPAQAAGASFTSIAFAGSEAIVAFRKLPDPSRNRYTGGLLVNDGSGWRVDEGAAAAVGADVPEIVAGLPDGGAAFAANGPEPARVFERGGPESPWQPTSTPLPGGREPGSLALFREGGQLRAIAAGSGLNTFGVESATPSPPGTPPVLIKPYPLEDSPESGVLRQTATGWNDEEHDLNNAHEPPGHYSFYDTVFQPDPISGVLIDPTGTQGWAVGGFVEPGDEHAGALDTADIDRYPADGSTPPGVSETPVTSTGATFAIGGGAQCAAPCADRANAGLGPDVWLSSALSRAGTIAGVRAFLYTGPRVSSGETDGPPTVTIPYGREYARYAQLLGGSPLAAFAAPSPTDLAGGEGESLFEQAFAGFPRPFGTAPAREGLTRTGGAQEECGMAPGCQSYYAFDSAGQAGSVRVIVLDDSSRVGATQQAWLSRELLAAMHAASPEPAIVIGNADLSTAVAAGDADAGEVARILLGQCPEGSSTCINSGARASAYFFDATEENVTRPLRMGSASIPTFGSGTIGYVNFLNESSGDFLGAGGFLLAEVNTAASARDANNVAPVTVRLIPNIGELALEAKDGTLLRRSEVSQFAGLARRPRAGNRSPNQQTQPETDPYIPIPSNCVGAACASGLLPEYSFSSSRPDIGDFVEPELSSANPDAVAVGANGKPTHDSKSGLFCAYNAGTTIVTITAGGLSSSLPVTVQAGSVRQPCGTVPLAQVPVRESSSTPAPAPAPAPVGPAVAASPAPLTLPVPSLPPVVPQASSAPSPPQRPTFFAPPVETSAVPAFLPPPPPTPARPTPPSGTSAVTSPVEMTEREEEREEATESVSNQAVAYDPRESDPTPVYVLGIVVLAAFAGASRRRRPRRGRRRAQVAPATVTTAHTQRRMSSRRQGHR